MKHPRKKQQSVPDANSSRRQQQQQNNRQRRRRLVTEYSSLSSSSSSSIRTCSTICMVSCFLILLHTDGNPAYVSSSAVVVVQAMLMVPSFTITTPRTTLRSRTTRIISSSKSKLYSITDEDQDEQNFPPPRRTRRIDEILEGEDPEHYPPEESIEYDDLDRRSMYNDLTMSVLSLESSLEREREKSSTLAIRLAKAERMIEDQQNRFDKEHTALVNKDDALAQTQRKLQDMERKLAQQEYQQQQPKISSTIAPDQQQQQQQQQQKQKQQKQQQQQTPSWQYPKLTSKERQYPMVSYWTLNANTGEIRGVVSCHPSIPDGTTIVTSALTSSSVQKAGASFVSDPLDEQHNNTNHQPATVITTQSGSKYQLGVRKKQQTATAAQYVPRSKDQQQQQQQQQQPGFGRGERQPQQQPNKDEVHPMNKLYPHLKYPLTGQLISNGLGTKYLLAGVPKRKPSGRSTIVKAYLSDDQARPIDTNKVYVIKLSTNTDKLKREYDNYCRIQHGLSNNIIDTNTIGSNPGGGDWIGNMVSQLVFDSRSTTQSYEQYQQSVTDEKNPFVKCYDFFPSCQGSIMYAQHSALVMEKGYEDLRDHVLELQHQEQQKQDSSSLSPLPVVSPNKVTMAPHLIQRSLLTAAICLNTLHTKARLVYTDLKAENLVFMDQQNIDSEDGEVVIKGIDLESCIPNGGHPIDYTPEVCPPEFAKFHLNGNSYDFVVGYTYDVWSFGMLAYELATGSPYFERKTPLEIMTIVGDPNFVPPFGNSNSNNSIDNAETTTPRIEDTHLYELIRSCLQINPNHRITVSQMLKHSYFQQQLSSTSIPKPKIGGGTFW